MMRRTFWDGLAMGAAAGMLFGVYLLSRRRSLTPMERTRMVIGRTAKRAVRHAQGTLNRVAQRFSD